jgi:DNA-binding NarL/FixJ family response regulator
LVSVLLVDDEPDVVEALMLALRAQEYELFTETSPLRALSLLRQRSIDVVISDERMPGMSGSEFLARVYEAHPDSVRIVLTGYANVDAAMRAINQGRIARFLCKPCLGDDLVRSVSEALKERAASRSLQLTAAHTPDVPAPRSGQASRMPLGGLSAGELAALSAREHQVLELLVDGLRVTQIAKRLCISTHTVRNHLKTLYRKLDVHSQGALIEHARGDAMVAGLHD